ncbi:hypothetical protein ACNUDN_26535 [Mycobacterium sp. smrl_JER01]|uniref:hypothetical protein n=1 Tax=Mycobacterium sp. smrl_JER01 TaxID=3402633 RepID=UPI003ACD2EE0
MSEAPARLRGAAAGLLTAALAVAAHGTAGGTVPAGAAAAGLALVATIVAAVAVSTPRSGQAPVMACLLGAGQLGGHVVLAAQGHAHGGGPGWAMGAAHSVAVFTGAVLICVGTRLCRAVSGVLGVVRRHRIGPPRAPLRVRITAVDHPMRWTLSLAGSMSHRGPPAGAHR